MSDRDERLSELRAAHGGIDPVLDQAADYARGVKAAQSVVRSQGHVMSLALKNNEALHHTNKKLVARCRDLDAENASLRRANALLDQQRLVLESTLADSGGNRWKALYLQARRVLALDQYGALNEGELAVQLEQMKRQQAELDALPERATDEEIAARIDGPEPTMPEHS